MSGPVLPNGGERRWVAKAQLLQRYIVAEDAVGTNLTMYLIEQHVAHERVLYERMVEAWGSVAAPKLTGNQRLVDYVSPELQNADSGIALNPPLSFAACGMDTSDVMLLSRFGFTLFAENVSAGGAHHDDLAYNDRLILTRIPEVLVEVLNIDRVDESFDPRLLSAKLEQVLRVLTNCASVEDAAAEISCKLAIKNGEPLPEPSLECAQKLLDDLASCRAPRTCPHGRPIFLELQESELASAFHRSWASNNVPVAKKTAALLLTEPLSECTPACAAGLFRSARHGAKDEQSRTDLACHDHSH